MAQKGFLPTWFKNIHSINVQEKAQRLMRINQGSRRVKSAVMLASKGGGVSKAD